MSETTPPGAAVARTECLGEADVARVRGAPPGEVPEDLAQHLAGCERCQQRVLFGALHRTRRRREMPRLPSPGRTLALLVLVAAAVLAFFVTLRALLVQL